jgi:hypothetical protein
MLGRVGQEPQRGPSNHEQGCKNRYLDATDAVLRLVPVVVREGCCDRYAEEQYEDRETRHDRRPFKSMAHNLQAMEQCVAEGGIRESLFDDLMTLDLGPDGFVRVQVLLNSLRHRACCALPRALLRRNLVGVSHGCRDRSVVCERSMPSVVGDAQPKAEGPFRVESAGSQLRQPRDRGVVAGLRSAFPWNLAYEVRDASRVRFPGRRSALGRRHEG